MKQYDELSRGLKLFINLLIWIPVSVITMTILMRIMPIRMILNFEGVSMEWSLPQSVPFGFADFIYIRVSILLSIVYAIVFAVLLSFVRVNSKEWWLSLSIFFVIYSLSILLGLYFEMGQWFREYCCYFLDVLLGPVIVLIEFEMIQKRHNIDMRNLLFLITLTVFLPSCACEKGHGNIKEPVPQVVSDNKPDMKEPSNVSAMVLWGVPLVGAPEEILNGLCSLPFFDADEHASINAQESSRHYSCTVIIDGVPFGMNINYPKDSNSMYINEITFVTSETSRNVRTKILKRLSDYYGKPDINDGEDGGYTWFPNGHFLKLRNFHAIDGGWTFYMMQ